MKNGTRSVFAFASLALLLIRPLSAEPIDVSSPGSDKEDVTLTTMPSGKGGVAPTITVQPVSLSVVTGASATFSVSATGTPSPSFQWIKNGERIDGATSATLKIAAASVSDAGAYAVEVFSGPARVLSNTVTLSVANAGTVTTAPQNQTVNAGANATFTIVAVGSGLTYQWFFNGEAISGATSASFTISDAGSTAAGVYTVDVSSAAGVIAAESAALSVHTDARLTNLSVRGAVGTGNRVLIVGLTIQGTGNKNVLLRAVGPTLATFNVTGVLSNPVLTLFGSDHKVIASNTGWGGTAVLTNAFTQVGAFALPAGSADSALLETLGSGGYSAVITGANNTTGVALAEVYDADTGTPTADLVNLSSRAFVAGGGNTLVAGFVITGKTSETVLIRGVGPTLGGVFGMGDALEDTTVKLFDSKGNQIAVNAAWDDDDKMSDADDQTGETHVKAHSHEISDADDRVGAFHFMAHSRDSALLVTLPPGAYSAQVSGDDGSTGIGMVEVFQVR